MKNVFLLSPTKVTDRSVGNYRIHNNTFNLTPLNLWNFNDLNATNSKRRPEVIIWIIKNQILIQKSFDEVMQKKPIVFVSKAYPADILFRKSL